MPEVYVIGHKSPEADSICSAIAYAELKNRTGDETHVAARLGPTPPDVAFVLDRFGVDEPVLVPHVRVRVRDVMTTEPLTAGPNTPLRAIGELMTEHTVRSIPIVDEGRLAGIVSERDLARRYLEELNIQSFLEKPVALGQITDTLEGKIVLGTRETPVAGRVLIGAMRPETIREFVREGDVVLMGDRENAQQLVLEAGICCLIVTGGFEPGSSQVETARAKGASILVTPYDTYAAARLINLSVPASRVMNDQVATAGPEDLLTEVIEDVLASAHREVIVLDESNRPVGIVTRSNLVRPPKRRVILVDHNERAQAADGIEDAQVLEIVDHHRLGDIETAEPILVINRPVGSTATIVASRYDELGVKIPPATAGILMAAILADTVLLKSPTATEADREAVQRLASLCGEDWRRFGEEMFAERARHASYVPSEVLRQDLKTYRLGETKIAVAQVELVNPERLLEMREQLLLEMKKFAHDAEYDTVILMVTDVIREGTQLLVAGKKRLAERAFDAKIDEEGVFLPGVISRKKQVAARLAEAARA
ncbi:MAG: putative manganese-dependent inorganic diphosphatase [Actinobacteria bacterium]|nr:MAG: putative manganese-dependent inorganic diphosphatase [Actinomycetota bacterium]